MLKKVTIFMITLFVPLSETVSAQEFTVESNLLYDATPMINLGAKYGLSPRWMLEVSGNYNVWIFSDNKKMKLWTLQPGVHYWTCSRFAGHLWETHLLGGKYNYGGMLPFSIKSSASGLGNKRYQGWLAGAGAGYGYSQVPGKRRNLEATLGLGYVHFSYNRFGCKTCGDKLGSGNKNYFDPTKTAISPIYIIK